MSQYCDNCAIKDSRMFNLSAADDDYLIAIANVLVADGENFPVTDVSGLIRQKLLMYATFKLIQFSGEHSCNLAQIWDLLQSPENIDKTIILLPQSLKGLFASYTKLSPESKEKTLSALAKKLDKYIERNMMAI